MTPTIITIFGASGDLTQRKLLPALYNNFRKGRLEGVKKIIGFARRQWSDEFFINHIRSGIKDNCKTFDEAEFVEFAKKLSYFQGDLSEIEDFKRLSDCLENLGSAESAVLFYLATSPDYYPIVCENLKSCSLSDETENAPRRLIIEKPFGNSLKTAKSLNHQLHKSFNENQVYRIDHYLGKETAQNILFFRFANTFFEPVWNSHYISNVQITVAESVDVGTRGGYYDKAGAIRDMIQSHLLQLLALVAMEPASSLDADAIRNEKVKVFNSIRNIEPTDCVCAQYAGYRQTEKVDENSKTPTYAAIKLFIDNWRWKGVPFYLRSGKAMAKRSSEIIVEFMPPPDVMFSPGLNESFTPNLIAICIQPNESIHLRFETKVPDTATQSKSVNMDFCYSQAFPDILLPDAYEKLLLDAIKGDASLFARSDGIEASWKIIDPIIEAWENDSTLKLDTYPRASWGPKASDELLAKDGHKWRLACSGKEAGCSCKATQ